MAQFSLFKYIKKWRYAIIAVCLLGCFAVYNYATGQQQYTATAVFKYSHAAAQNGQNPDGSTLDASEIISSSVISDVISELGLNTNVESIRSRFSVNSIIPADEQEKLSSYTSLGMEYIYNPVIYRVSFTVDSSSNMEYARMVLDSLLSNYLTFYCDKYIVSSQFSSNASSLTAEQEFIDCVEILSSTIDESIYYLNNRAKNYPDFYSAETGYSFQDLAAYYQYVRDNQLERLNAYIKDNHLVKNQTLLLEGYYKSISQYESLIRDLDVQIAEASAIITQFSDKTQDNVNSIDANAGDSENGANYIISNVNDENSSAVETTYDALINQYAELLNSRIMYETRMSRARELLEIFSGTTTTDSEMADWATQQIKSIVERINELYGISSLTINEFNEKNGADNLTMLTNVVTSSSISVMKYMLLAVVVFIIIGCGLAVVLGRGEEFVDYFLYGDKHTGLPNRVRCDMAIDKYAQKLLPDEFCCMIIMLNLKYPNRADYTRKIGDELLSAFSAVLKMVFSEAEYLGYNENGMFMMFMPNCSARKAAALNDRLSVSARDADKGKDFPFQYKTGYAVTTEDHSYEVRDLLRKAITRSSAETDGTREEDKQ